jgi:hypothetical protein
MVAPCSLWRPLWTVEDEQEVYVEAEQIAYAPEYVLLAPVRLTGSYTVSWLNDLESCCEPTSADVCNLLFGDVVMYPIGFIHSLEGQQCQYWSAWAGHRLTMRIGLPCSWKKSSASLLVRTIWSSLLITSHSLRAISRRHNTSKGRHILGYAHRGKYN